MTSRRDFVHSLGLGGAALLAGCAGVGGRRHPVAAREVAIEVTGQAPHNVVFIMLSGGIDNLMSVMPIDQHRFPGAVDTCYRYEDCVRIGDRLFGPHIGGLAPHAADLFLVHGLRVDTVAHSRGWFQAMTGRSSWHQGEKTIWEHLAAVLPGTAPVPVLKVPTRSFDIPGGIPGGAAFSRNPLPDLSHWSALDADTLQSYQHDEALHRPSWFDDLAVEQQRLADAAPSAIKGETRAAFELKTAAIHELLATPIELDGFGQTLHSSALRLVVEGLRQQTAKVFVVQSPGLWFDTHANHEVVQPQRLAEAFGVIGRFLEALKQTSTEHGTIFDHTTIVIGSEIGRYPKLNGNLGKDHWPEVSWMMLGRGIRAGGIGAVDATMRALPADHRSGRTDGGQRRPIRLESISATLLRVAGARPSSAAFDDDEVILPALASI
jgi:uncharacterized protein (DUF1501 family)